MSDILVETADRVVTITLNRASKKNAITDEMYGDIAAALNSAANDAAVHVALIKGDGPDFCAGNDIKMFMDATENDKDLSNSNVQPFLDALSRFPKPLIAAVTGRAIGIGVTMLLHCDLVYVAEDADLKTPFIDLGLVPEAASAYLLPALIGHRRAFSMFAFTEALSGRKAEALGLANLALPAADVVPHAQAAALALARKPSSALMATKRLMRDAEGIKQALEDDRRAFIEQLSSPEASAAFAAFTSRKR